MKAIDGYLLAAILLIFALGLYELFISKIDIARDSDAGPSLLQIRSVDDLKDRIAKVVLLVLVIEFFQHALRVKYERPLDLLHLGVGLLFVAAALFLSNWKPGKEMRDK